MPEGDTIHRAAHNLRKVLLDAQIVTIDGRPEVRHKEKLPAATVTGLEARGKHLIFHFDNEVVLHSHMGMTGSWHIYPRNHPWQKPAAQAVVVLTTAQWSVVCFTPKTIRIITARELQRDNYLQRLGPDILGPPIADDVMLQRMRSQNTVSIGEAVMNQTVVCGIGNVYKSEILFLERLHPLNLVGQLSDQQLLKLRDRAVMLMKRNLDNGPRTTRFGGDQQKLWVYGRQDGHCLKCDDTIQLLRQGDSNRSTCFCPTCQVRIP